MIETEGDLAAHSVGKKQGWFGEYPFPFYIVANTGRLETLVLIDGHREWSRIHLACAMVNDSSAFWSDGLERKEEA